MSLSSFFIAPCSGSKRIIKLTFILSVLVNLAFFIVLFTPLTETLFKPLIITEQPRASEVIVVLSGGLYDSGLPSFGTMVRLRKALELYRQHWADRIICAGGTRLKKNRKSIAQVMKETLVLYGIPANHILTQDETVNTYNDISHLLKKFEGQFNFNQTIFVTSSYHTYRVKGILMKKKIHARIISADPYELKPRIWSERLDLFRDVVREYLAICYFKLKGYL